MSVVLGNERGRRFDNHRHCMVCHAKSVRALALKDLRRTCCLKLGLCNKLHDASNLLDLPLRQLRHETRAHDHRLLRQLPLAQHLHSSREARQVDARCLGEPVHRMKMPQIDLIILEGVTCQRSTT